VYVEQPQRVGEWFIIELVFLTMKLIIKQNYHHGDLRNALLEAADEVLQEQGLHGFTLRACARRAGVSHAAPKHHFNDVRGLLTAVAVRGFMRLVAMLRTQLDDAEGNLDDEMFATAKAYADFALQYPEHFRIMFRADLLTVDRKQPPASMAATFVELTNVILRQRGEAEMANGEFGGEMSADLINDIILGWSHVHGYAHLRLEGQLAMVPDAAHDAHMRRASQRLGQLIRAQVERT
jgi:AcrR family transcriptional regulator